MLFSLSMFPVGAGESLKRPVAEVVEEIDDAGLDYQVTGMDTVIEGAWDDVLPVIRRAEERLSREYGRVFMVLVVDDHPGSEGRLRRSVDEVSEELGQHVPR
jgi:uncharacterized protein (TIGR00106 family)